MLFRSVENADKAGMTEAEINARTTDAAARAGEIGSTTRVLQRYSDGHHVSI